MSDSSWDDFVRGGSGEGSQEGAAAASATVEPGETVDTAAAVSAGDSNDSAAGTAPAGPDAGEDTTGAGGVAAAIEHFEAAGTATEEAAFALGQADAWEEWAERDVQNAAALAAQAQAGLVAARQDIAAGDTAAAEEHLEDASNAQFLSGEYLESSEASRAIADAYSGVAADAATEAAGAYEAGMVDMPTDVATDFGADDSALAGAGMDDSASADAEA